MKPAAAGKVEDRLDDGGPRPFQTRLRRGEIVGIENDQRSAGADRAGRGQAAGQASIAELAIGRAIVGEAPAEGFAVERLRTGDVGDVELDVVDLAVVASGTHGVFLCE